MLYVLIKKKVENEKRIKEMSAENEKILKLSFTAIRRHNSEKILLNSHENWVINLFGGVKNCREKGLTFAPANNRVRSKVSY